MSVQIQEILIALRHFRFWPLASMGHGGGVNDSCPPKIITLAILLLFISLAQAQTTGALHIISPANGTRVECRMVTVKFELSPGVSANGIPVFRVQIDRQSPVLISDTEYDLYWRSPGWHTVNVSLVDANGTPMFGAQSQVQFEVVEDNEGAGLSANHWGSQTRAATTSLPGKSG